MDNAKKRPLGLAILVEGSRRGRRSWSMAGRSVERESVTTRLRPRGQPRLAQLQLLILSNHGRIYYLGAELALLPNSVYFNPLSTAVEATIGVGGCESSRSFRSVPAHNNSNR